MSETLETLSYWVSRPGEGELRALRLPAELAAGHSLLRAECGAVSAGTERLVGLALVPSSCADAMACRYMEGGFSLPVKYGYALVGTGVSGALAGQRAFVMHPHQELAVVADEHVTRLPDAVPSRRAVLIPNLETALNATWDAELLPDDRTVVVGAGAVGLLVGYVLWRTRETTVTVADADPARRDFASSLPWIDRACAPDELAGTGAQVAFHASGAPMGLRAALDAVGFEGRVIELSWYGERPVTLELGTHFHYQRKRILASQVSVVAPSHRRTHGYRERLDEVLALLDDPSLDPLLGVPVPFRSLPEFMAQLYRGRNPYPVPLIEYRFEVAKPMFTVAVKDHVMIAHSFRGAVFGPAQRLHGATFVITTEYRTRELDENGIVFDIGRAHTVLGEVLEPLRYRNLDEYPEFSGSNTTTEYLARYLHQRIAERVRAEFSGELRVVLEESHVAWGAFEAPI